jgi:hypothetical protein
MPPCFAHENHPGANLLGGDFWILQANIPGSASTTSSSRWLRTSRVNPRSNFREIEASQDSGRRTNALHGHARALKPVGRWSRNGQCLANDSSVHQSDIRFLIFMFHGNNSRCITLRHAVEAQNHDRFPVHFGLAARSRRRPSRFLRCGGNRQPSPPTVLLV